jgi:hypothetical protein
VNQQWQAPPPPAERIYEFRGMIRVIAGTQPGAMVVTLEGRKLAASGVLGFCQNGSVHNGPVESSFLHSLLREGDVYLLQLEHDIDEGGAQRLLGKLCWFKATAEGYELGFEFDDGDEETALFSESLLHRRSFH